MPPRNTTSTLLGQYWSLRELTILEIVEETEDIEDCKRKMSIPTKYNDKVAYKG